jgi:hypothetical protein
MKLEIRLFALGLLLLLVIASTCQQLAAAAPLQGGKAALGTSQNGAPPASGFTLSH